MPDNTRAELRAYMLELVSVLFQNNDADGIENRLPEPASVVTAVHPKPRPLVPELISGFVLDGSFSTAAIMAMDSSGGDYQDRYDVITAYVTPTNLPEHLGARISMHGQPGMTISRIVVEAETLQNPPRAPRADSIPGPNPKPSPARTATAPTASETGAAVRLIGGVERVPAFDLSGLIDDVRLRQIHSMRSFDNFADASPYLAAEPDMLLFGLPPDFEPIVRLGTGEMTIGLMVDAPELGFIDSSACLYELSSAGMSLMDARLNALIIVWRSVTDKRISCEQEGDPERLDRWQRAANELKSLMGWSEFAPSGVRGFAFGAKRRKPERAPTPTKWRTDAGGNGVLASRQAWGDAPVRRPRSIEAALRTAKALAPAAALHALREALVMANRTNDPGAAQQIYAAMVEPLEQLGRPQVAARSSALSAAK